MLNLTDEAAKKEQADSVASLIRSMRDMLLLRTDRMAQTQKLHQFNSFWLDYTLKGITSKSLVLRLFSWDQLGDIIKQAELSRPLADSYLGIFSPCPSLNHYEWK